MKFSIFQELLTRKNPEAEAYKGSAGVTITYKPGGRAYHYTGSIYAIAERLKLIPFDDYDVPAEAEKAAAWISQGPQNVHVTHLPIYDTLRYNHPSLAFTHEAVGKDDYDRPLFAYRLAQKEA